MMSTPDKRGQEIPPELLKQIGYLTEKIKDLRHESVN